MSAGIPSPEQAEPVRKRSGHRRIRRPVLSGRGGDHAAIYHFLTPIFQGPTREEFKASLEDPFYEPQDRLLIKRGSRITSHVHVTHRVMQFGPVQIPSAWLNWLATLPECRNSGDGTRLLRAAETHIAETGALVGWLRTKIPHFFRRTGWALCGRHCYSRADARAVMGRLLDRGLRRGVHRRLHIRPWRRWEEAALVRIYDQNLPGRYGPLQRTEAYWRWLIRRQAYDQMFVALDGPGLLDLEEINTKIVGFSVVRGGKIVEMLAAPGQKPALAELLARACGDAVEHDRHSVVLYAPPPSSLHRIFEQAGGLRHFHEADRGEVHMARLLAPLKLLRVLCVEFHRRAEETGLPRPLELGLLVEGKKYELEITRQSARAVSRRIGRSYLQLNVADFTRLVLGQVQWNRALSEGRIRASTALAAEAGRVLFPRLPLWHPPFDHLLA